MILEQIGKSARPRVVVGLASIADISAAGGSNGQLPFKWHDPTTAGSERAIAALG
ncbi:MAG: hypothetical protein QF756_05300 [Dehalococcoidia bacterium]|nr:hypothetical protein [Dehalococcoidia bacterium]MDP7160665.1 hypothetical protein [Dehalococcoidia bacterium]